jgi:hypothetical protein
MASYPEIRIDDQRVIRFRDGAYHPHEIFPQDNLDPEAIVFGTCTYLRGQLYDNFTGEIVFDITAHMIFNIDEDDVSPLCARYVRFDTDYWHTVLDTQTLTVIPFTAEHEIMTVAFPFVVVAWVHTIQVSRIYDTTDGLPTIVVNLRRLNQCLWRMYKNFIVIVANDIDNIDVQSGSKYVAVQVPCTAATVFQIVPCSGKRTKAALREQ